VEELVLLAKSLRPLPEKWHGLKDKKRAIDSVTLTLSSMLMSKKFSWPGLKLFGL